MVYINKCETYDKKIVLEKVSEIFEQCGGIEKYASPGKKIVIKPNLITRKKPEDAATTHPSIVWAVAKLCLEQGADVTIAESPGGLYTESVLRSVYGGCGIEQAAKDSGAKLNFDTSITSVHLDSGLYLKKLNVITPIAKADVVINIAKLKTHGMMVYTGAVKNMFGAIAGLDKADYHFRMSDYDEFANAIIDICLATKPTLSIIDGIIGMERDGPTAGDPRLVGVLMASENPFDLDMVASGVIKVEPQRIPILKNAIFRKLCPASVDEIEVVGCKISDVAVDNFIMRYVDNKKTITFLNGFLGRYLSKLIKPSPVFDKKKCKSCGECAKCCPAKIIEVKKGECAKADLNKCIRCYCCQELCPFKAVSIKRPLINKLMMTK